MGRAAITKLNKRGALTLPEEIRRDLSAGTQFVVQREGRNILLFPLLIEPVVPYDLTARASSFANELIAESYGDYVVQVALTDADKVLPAT
jgi:bifunctional DNA-binding transcriptional regulator/antitoxin component of YhaV-PrlF toxin-antitoxin module